MIRKEFGFKRSAKSYLNIRRVPKCLKTREIGGRVKIVFRLPVILGPHQNPLE